MASLKKGLAGIGLRAVTVLLLSAWLPAACATARPCGTAANYAYVKSMLDQSGPDLDYDTLLRVHQTLLQAPRPVAHIDRLLRLLIDKRNEDPRIDQMILIFAARNIGGSRFPIPDADGIFAAILQKEDRISTWVISFVAEAIGDYAHDLPAGDQLADLVETQLDRVRKKDRSGEEYFGTHFLPPPKSAFIRTYISGIADQASRQRERHRYYMLIQDNLTEPEIESAMRYLREHGMPETGEKCPLLMQCLLRARDRLPFK